ncbi:DUF2125 domain-containing protein [Primorskyibacter aestuariivivens]|uniref:DUF2125 domain-containing protein n=1 Tax=Primorskyibacter aestuariivivens TaxID=1888912 RepID=UPI0023011411|nr:DUF2125 domain-containing protein [Primorskyibacter aestuariivivens]MDA7429342.1 DUF2125 domain-containing protein [Primorskyibacter aestuariivivens]
MLKRLTFLVIAAALGWSAWWYWGASQLRGSYEDWFAERRDDGWQAGYSSMEIRGFPNRHDTTWSDVQIVDPDSGLGWDAPFFQLFLLSYNRNHAIAVWPDTQSILTPDGRYDVSSDSLQASLITESSDHLLLRSNLAADVVNVTDPGGDTTALAALRASVARVEGTVDSYDIALGVEGLALSNPFLRAAEGAVPDTFQETRLQAQVTFDRPISVGSLSGNRPRPTALDLTLAELKWGPMGLRLTGEMKIDGKGWIEGDLHIRAEDWREMLRVARNSGEVPQAMVDGLEGVLGLLSQISGGGQNIDVSLRFDDKRTLLGPLPVGPAPRIELR